MKVCPKCGAEYTDRELNYCLADGSALADGTSLPTVALVGDPTSDPTVVMTQAQVERPTNLEPRQKSRGPLIAGIVVLTVVLLVVSGALLAVMMSKDDEGKANQARTRSNAPSTINATPVESPTPASTRHDNTSTTPDDVTEIAWVTPASTFDTGEGVRYRFRCPTSGVTSMVWGSDVYMVDSSVCTAAVHAGKITLESGGDVSIEIRPGRKTYGATARNGITTHNSGQAARSFVFIDE